MKKNVFTLLSLLVIAGVGCNRIETSIIPVTDTDAIVFTGDITKSGTEVVQNAATRADATKSKTEFVTGDKIGVFVVPFKNESTKGELASSGNYADNVAFIRDADGKFAPAIADRITFPNAKTHISLYAFAMYSSAYNTLGENPKVQTWSVSQDQTVANGSEIVKSDLMTAQAADVAPGTTPDLTFAHRMAMVNVQFTTLATYRGAQVTGASLTINNVITDATVDMTNNSIAPAAVSGSTANNIKAFQLSSTANTTLGGLDCVYEAVVVPQTVLAQTVGATIKLTTNAGSFDFKCELPTALTYKTGCVTKITLSFENEYKLSLQSVSITPWGDGGSTTVDARQPAIMNFKVDVDPNSKAAQIRYAVLGIDSEQYVADVELIDGVLRCAYMQQLNKVGDKLKTLNFQDASGNQIAYASAVPEIALLNIPGNPTSQGYNEIISTLTFN